MNSLKDLLGKKVICNVIEGSSGHLKFNGKVSAVDGVLIYITDGIRDSSLGQSQKVPDQWFNSSSSWFLSIRLA